MVEGMAAIGNKAGGEKTGACIWVAPGARRGERDVQEIFPKLRLPERFGRETDGRDDELRTARRLG